MKINTVIILFTALLFMQCNQKKKRIESKSFQENEQKITTDFSKQKMDPAKFFVISQKIALISKKYRQMDHSNEAAAESNINKMEVEIQSLYTKYNITEKEFNEFGENHYQEIEIYLKKHPEIQKKLH